MGAVYNVAVGLLIEDCLGTKFAAEKFGRV
jgi:hypothetical protein